MGVEKGAESRRCGAKTREAVTYLEEIRHQRSLGTGHGRFLDRHLQPPPLPRLPPPGLLRLGSLHLLAETLVLLVLPGLRLLLDLLKHLLDLLLVLAAPGEGLVEGGGEGGVNGGGVQGGGGRVLQPLVLLQEVVTRQGRPDLWGEVKERE